MEKRRVILCLCVALCLALISAGVVLAQEQISATQLQQIRPREIKIDRDHDGVIDRLEVYDGTGALIRVEADTNADGTTDEWAYYEGGNPVRAEKDLNGDGKPNTWLTYDGNGVVTKTESDINGDGTVEEWVYFEGGNPVRAEKDTSGDGQPDTWITY